jgi:TolA-binding protein
MTTEQRFGKVLDDALGDGPPDAALRVQRANVLAALRRGRRPLARLRWELAAGVVVAAVAVLSVVVWRARSTTATASWRGGAELRTAAPLTAGNRTEAIDFSDGSRVLLEPKTSASVVSLDASRTEVVLKHGKLAASVRRRAPGATFSVKAGPYDVRVVGTKFTVAWDQVRYAVRVSVTEGQVRVSGGALGTQTVVLSPGEHWERKDPAPALEVAAPEPSAAAPLPAADPSTRPAATVASPAPRTVGQLAQAGKYREALALAEQRGFERVLNELPEGELLALGNAARYSGSSSRAREAMLTLRSRFPGRSAAGLSAFYLAKIAEQLDNNPKEAARWLRVFLSESPSGSLAADARASLLGVLLSSGATEEATSVARDYLRHHPNGPVADRARQLVLRSEGK